MSYNPHLGGSAAKKQNPISHDRPGREIHRHVFDSAIRQDDRESASTLLQRSDQRPVGYDTTSPREGIGLEPNGTTRKRRPLPRPQEISFEASPTRDPSRSGDSVLPSPILHWVVTDRSLLFQPIPSLQSPG